ncbi:hypothetical protein PHYBLDRAFT_157154 [Phycomyces blakesleeanus NRRL 1555(-)]|uniref:Transcription regulator Rua1 C-terminal domain-containing protein n=1 Tax=Phycomyces blakesleeanus (strain ATCC 8743b / DSM 1359 / FGSC 10004 / NBRC 33097 / NRRL 1555) TaxID=763407 RepID=A0A167Q581_PHYB8|nr:hypothetical protein PHYBLDRAFT_157154 [Phycomyces blakesleeanus NRRL 1555(-)]OAD79089.1 hypothetical protein PHYBLDRAFT_157154 [Phycomyces blakesleeanus NRRL 1555(-)]|eukprot:XP_018297129.1 hypothetical protein PHYBLDRAFT_157154 [Phycomyces blakesleeanus NRRL 1555(-)]
MASPSYTTAPTTLTRDLYSSSTPRQQSTRYKGDSYKPEWVRYAGHMKEGYCDLCKPGKWLQLKNSAYWYHKQFLHGISSVSRKPFIEPLKQRRGVNGMIEGLCHQCYSYVPISSRKRKNHLLWYRHAHKCHVYTKTSSSTFEK